MKKIYVILVCVVVLFLIVASIGLWYFAVISGAIFSFMPNPPKPEITYAEFPFRIICEIDGIPTKLEDTIVCEFDGIENFGSGGKWRKWKAHLKSGNDRFVLLKINETSELYCNYGLPEYYMGDLRFLSKEEYEQNLKRDFDSMFIILGEVNNGEYTSKFISTKEALEQYKLKIIDVHYSPPIQNSFK